MTRSSRPIQGISHEKIVAAHRVLVRAAAAAARPGPGLAAAAGQGRRALPARAPADGYTLFFGATPQLLAVPLIQKVSYDPLKDFAPISVLGTKNGIDPLGNTPAEFAELIRSEVPLWRAAVDAAGIKQE
jgi:tripartite-type tricarboxylate transporter receptor subunit TctC